MRAFGLAVGDGLQRLERGRDLPGRGDLDREMAVGEVEYGLAESLGAAVDQIERGDETRGQTPLDVRRGIGDRGARHRRAGRGKSETGEELSTSCAHTVLSDGKRLRLHPSRRLDHL